MFATEPILGNNQNAKSLFIQETKTMLSLRSAKKHLTSLRHSIAVQKPMGNTIKTTSIASKWSQLTIVSSLILIHLEILISFSKSAKVLVKRNTLGLFKHA